MRIYIAGSYSRDPVGGTRAAILAASRLMDAVTGPDTLVVGHNVSAFDLPRLRQAYIRARLSFPQISGSTRMRTSG